MIIEHNMLAMYTNGQLGINKKKNAKCTEKLASGYRVNRAADDAAGLSISEKMRGQIRGLKQGSRNVMDGISLVQVADGALNETHSVLQRMRELAVQAANDTNTADDRTTIQEEINQLIEEVDRIANQTEYNSAIYPLLEKGISAVNIPLQEKSQSFKLQQAIIYDGVSYNIGDIITVTGITSNGKEVIFDGGTWYQDRGCISNSPTYSLHKSDLKIDGFGRIYHNSLSDGEKAFFMYKYNDGTPDPIGRNPESDCPKRIGMGYEYCTIDLNTIDSCQKIWIQAGANSNQGMYISLVDATARGIGLDDINVMSSIDATNAISNIDGAISKVSEYRSSFGAQQNRLEHAMAVDDNTAENLQDAESKIRDANMADEMVECSKTNILIQVGQSMLAQANQSSQGVLQLLQ